jgi:uncharacterized membrane protein
VAFCFGALGLDVLSRLGGFPAAPLAATWLLLGAFAGTIFAALTGLVDWWGMVPGSRKRRWATWHMLLLAVAQWFGGVLVYRMGMRVSTVEGAETERA